MYSKEKDQHISQRKLFVHDSIIHDSTKTFWHFGEIGWLYGYPIIKYDICDLDM